MEDKFSYYDKHYMRMGNQPPELTNMQKYSEKFALSEKWLPDNLQSRILDIGCGWGNLLQNLNAMGFRNLYGVDINLILI